eukprot:jgi/Tetstr1/447871/TSEL_035181.t2
MDYIDPNILPFITWRVHQQLPQGILWQHHAMTVENRDAALGVLRPDVPNRQVVYNHAAHSPLKLKSSTGSSPSPPPPRPTPPSTVASSAPAVEDDRIPAHSPTGAMAKQADTAARRRMAAEWVSSLTGDSLPTDTDGSFRRHLRDGVLLCRLLNAVKPGTITRIVEECCVDSNTGEVIQTMENVTNFLKSANAVGIPSEYIFSVSDLEETEGGGERPRVVDCLLCLKRMHEGQKLNGQYSTPSRSPFGAGPPYRRATASGFPASGLRATPGSEYGTPGEGFEPGVTPPFKMAAGKGVAAAVGVTRLMQQCTAMLRERMWTDGAGRPAPPVMQTPTPPRGAGATPESALEAMGPVLESVLGSLTQEYEKRLLAKDHEMKTVQEQLAAEQARREAAEADARAAVAEAEARVAAEAAAGADAAQSAEAAAMLAEAEAGLAAARKETERMRGELAALRDASGSRQRELELDLMATREKLAGLADIEEAYKAVCAENRDLYNQVQDLKGAIRVYCRVRPRGKTGDASEACLDLTDTEIAAYSEKGLRKMFQFDKVFGEISSQDDVYIETAPLVRSVLDGYNVCIFAYGQTGSGKTHTMSGTNVEQMSGRGINYRALDDLFELAAHRSGEWEYSINVQMLEIYNEVLRDLLVDPAVAHRKDNRLDIRMTERSGNNVPDAVQVAVTCTEDVLEVMERGASNRAVGETKMNQRSSRSHQVLTVMIDGRNTVTGAHSHACLNLIDLAGSERVQRSEATGDRLKEAQHINKSLSALGDVMNALALQSNHVPYRNSKLTQLLQDSLGGQAKTMMFMHISPESSSYGETVSTLGFGQRVSQVTLGAATKNQEGAELFAAREAIARLEAGTQGAGAAVERLRAEVAQKQAAAAHEAAAKEAAAAELRAAQKRISELQAEVDAAKASAAAARESTPSPGPAEASSGRVSSRVAAPTPSTSAGKLAGPRALRTTSASGGKEAPTASRIGRPQTARTAERGPPHPRGSLTQRGERPASAKLGQSAVRTPSDSSNGTASRVPRLGKGVSAIPASTSKTASSTRPMGTFSATYAGGSLSRRSSMGGGGRWV